MKTLLIIIVLSLLIIGCASERSKEAENTCKSNNMTLSYYNPETAKGSQGVECKDKYGNFHNFEFGK